MALDPALKDNIDPNAWKALEALDARLTALEQGSGAPLHPNEVVEKYPDGSELTYRKV